MLIQLVILVLYFQMIFHHLKTLIMIKSLLILNLLQVIQLNQDLIVFAKIHQNGGDYLKYYVDFINSADIRVCRPNGSF